MAAFRGHDRRGRKGYRQAGYSEHAGEYKRQLVEHVGQTGDVEETARWGARNFLDTTTGFEFLTFDVILHITRVMVKNALEEEVNQSDYL